MINFLLLMIIMMLGNKNFKIFRFFHCLTPKLIWWPFFLLMMRIWIVSFFSKLSNVWEIFRTMKQVNGNHDRIFFFFVEKLFQKKKIKTFSQPKSESIDLWQCVWLCVFAIYFGSFRFDFRFRLLLLFVIRILISFGSFYPHTHKHKHIALVQKLFILFTLLLLLLLIMMMIDKRQNDDNNKKYNSNFCFLI